MPYTKKNWQRNEIITEDGLNHIETGIEANDTAIKKALQRDIVEANIQKVGPTETSRAEIVQKENGSSLNLIISKDVDENIIQTEEGRVRAEEKRVEAEQSRVLAEAERKKAEAARVLSENKRQQDTSAAIAKTEEATQAAVAKAQTATDNATTAANKAEAAAKRADEAAKGASENVLNGAGYGTLVNVNDAWPSPVLKAKVLGQSNQVTTTGKNIMHLINSGTANGVNLTANGDGSYHIKGTQTAGFTRFYTDDGIKKPLAEFGLKVGDTVYLSAAEASSKLYLAMFFFDETGSSVYTQAATSASATKYTIAENVTQAYVCISLDGSVGTSVDSDFHPMISLNSNKDWESYTGGKPSPSPDYPQEITNLNKTELVITGKNLLSDAILQQVAADQSDYIEYADGVMTVNSNNGAAWNSLPTVMTVPPGDYIVSFAGSGVSVAVGDGTKHIANSASNNNKFVRLSLKVETSLSFKFISADSVTFPVTLTNIQLEAGSKATAYEPHQSKATPIDLQGNELCSLPNGVKDEVVIDAEGNVSLIKRVAKIDASTVNLKSMQKQNNNKWIAYKSFPEITSEGETKGAISSKFIHKYMLSDGSQYGNFTITADGNLCFGIPESLYPKEGEWVSVTPEVNAWFDGLKEGLFIYASYKKPQTIPLGKVELPALPEATSNVWNDGNIPANVYINYLKDVNIAYGKLESQLSQITMALSMMDTPTVIPEISEDEPTLIPELEESPIEESSI